MFLQETSVTFLKRKNYRSLGWVFPSRPCKSKGCTPNVAFTFRSGLCCPLWALYRHSLPHAMYSSNTGCLEYVASMPFLPCTFAHPGPSLWNDLASCPTHSSITPQRSFPWAPAPTLGPKPQGWAGGLSWSSLGPSALLCGTPLCTPLSAPPPGHCLHERWTAES